VVAGAGYSPFSTFLGFVAVACSSTNVVGGFLITDRMLKMFKKEKEQQITSTWLNGTSISIGAGLIICLLVFLILGRQLREHSAAVLRYLYIVSGVLFILGLKGLSSPKWARRGMFLAEFGMLVAIVGTLFNEEIKPQGYIWIVLG